MTWRRAGALAYLGLAALGVLAILGFYAQRLTVPLPLFAADEAAYLLHALYPDDVVARNPYVASAVNGLHLSAVRAVVLAGGDVVIGDRYGTSCARLLADTVEDTFRSLGYSVGRNKPYAGGFITEHYGNPANGLHAIQLELNRAVYMDERRRERGPKFAEVADDFVKLADALAQIPLEGFGPFQAAAE